MHVVLLEDYKTKSNWGPALGHTAEQQQAQEPLAALPILHQILFVLSDRIAQKLKAYCFYPTPGRAQKYK